MESEYSSVTVDSAKRKCEEKSENEELSNKKIKSEITENSVTESDSISNRERKPKKVVVLLCYQGKNYFGMQRNHNLRTVEYDFLQALHKAGIITQEECDNPKNMKFQRAARTDKGVSAVRQIVSLKIPLKEICDAFPNKVNQYLPQEINVLCIKRVTQAFDAKIACDARTYSYMLPTFAFAENDGGSEEYRITDARIQEVNNFLKSYIGTHNFYNFTSGRLPADKSCIRYIMSCECGKPFTKEGIEFSVIQIKGQSFMLHQIRKMIGLAIAVMQNLASVDILDKAFKTERIDIPKAPGLGLMLEDLHYNWYNNKFGGDGIHEPLQWDECREAIYKFKMEQIYPNIASTERNEKSMLQWIQTLKYHTYDVREEEVNSIMPAESKTETECGTPKSNSTVSDSTEDKCVDKNSEFHTVSDELNVNSDTSKEKLCDNVLKETADEKPA